jgi:hypothetical protein
MRFERTACVRTGKQTRYIIFEPLDSVVRALSRRRVPHVVFVRETREHECPQAGQLGLAQRGVEFGPGEGTHGVAVFVDAKIDGEVSEDLVHECA